MIKGNEEIELLCPKNCPSLLIGDGFCGQYGKRCKKIKKGNYAGRYIALSYCRYEREEVLMTDIKKGKANEKN